MRDFQQPGRSAVYACNGMCATSHPLAAKTAIQMLEAGGNAVDAAIAAAVLLGLCEPQSTGIGGDCFVLVKPAGSEKITALNGSGHAPAGLSADAIRAAGHQVMPLDSANAVTIPGAIDAFCRLSEDWGKLGLKASLAPAIHYAEAGIPVAPRVAFDWAHEAHRLQGAAREYYLNASQPLQTGQMFRSPAQAEVLRRIALHGRDGFYQGEVAQDMVDSLQNLGGAHQLGDFAAAQSQYTTPISGIYRGYELVEHPPNGQGATALLINNILSHFDLHKLDPFGPARAHLEAEAARLAYDARDRFIADAAHTTRLDHMLAAETGKKLAALIDPNRAMACAHTRSENVHKDTVYLTVVDKDQMAVSMIYSIFHAFGSGIASDKFGILFQNRGAGFSLIKGHPNEAGGNKRPLHTIIPAMLRHNGRLVMPFGVMGGAYQPNGHARVLSNMIDFGLSPQAAIDAPRSFAFDGEMSVERGYDDQTRARLAEMGHKVSIPHTAIGGAQAIWIDHQAGVLIGASDPRKDGCALGY
ncbi:MAG: gamma-glutamyltransferase [Rhodobacterales bacterium]|nr:MAG: gamma-glutamyltransferase [Rhodobacterales bacterium]